MYKTFSQTFSILLVTLSLAACSTPEEKAASYIENAKTMFAGGDLDKAEIEYKNALQINKNLPEALIGLAKIYERKRDWPKAYALLSQIRELAPRHIEGRIMLAQLLLASNQLDQALSDAIEILELAPENALAHSLMATVQVRLENYGGALQSAKKALLIDPNNSDAILVQARVLMTKQKYAAAQRLLDKAIRKNPENAALYTMKLQVYANQGDKKAIKAVYLSLIERFPEEVAYKSALAQQYIIGKNIDDAEKLFEQIVVSKPDSLEHKLRLLVFKFQYRSIDAAIALAKSYISSDQNEYRYRFVLGELFERNQQPEQAINVYRKIIEDDELNADGLEARNKIASIELSAGNTEKASALIREVLAQDIVNRNALLLEARLQLAGRDYDAALVNLRTVLRDNPDSARALELLGHTYDALGSPELAIESYTKAFRLNPGKAANANRLAENLISQRN